MYEVEFYHKSKNIVQRMFSKKTIYKKVFKNPQNSIIILKDKTTCVKSFKLVL